ncbi:hypothetical protein K2173_027381 [Erythroxylum novogranatense]|uniref:Uncharacterized protein n=1 Tax=Erythroxylum novogranatense TaxID=1862640 RepID=A0AAV8U1P9_9ROSI|nr:hypothetical protein K2173_027381 [Erythroxylum novogranatense]
MREIEVRTLSGESTTVSLPANKTVKELKHLLTLAFPPASSFPTFHLFFKGVKLSVECGLGTLDIEPGDFFVLIPFTKKDRPKKSEFSNNLPPQQASISKFANSAYSDMLQELSSLFDKPAGDNTRQLNYEPGRTDFGHKRKRDFDKCNDSWEDEGGPCAFLWKVLQSPDKSIFEQQNCQKFVEILQSMNCLSNPDSQSCAFLAIMASGGRGVFVDNGASCLCPAWLKRILEAFAFLVILSAFLRMRRQEITLALLKEALAQLGKFGSQVVFEDIEHLSLICPKVVAFANNDPKLAKSAEAFVIINSGTEEMDQIENNHISGRKAMSLSKAFNSMEKQETFFRSYMWEATKCFIQSKSGNGKAILFCLEDMIKVVNEGAIKTNQSEAKSTKRRDSSTSSSHSFRQRCHQETNQLLPVDMVQHLKRGIGSKGQIVHIEDISARKPIYVEVPRQLSENMKSALNCLGISQLYSHQEESILASLAGKNVVVATKTSSGKSLCYNVPVLEVLSQNLSSCAMYLFPTKALAQDQRRALLAMTEGLDCSINIGVYDGDTSQEDRLWLRDNARLLITNPDMLHLSILPYHRQFSRILANLRFVVIDEAHAYKGAFGCHTALILRRLRRLCSHVYGSEPSFVFCTATLANPREHCMELANLSTLELINNDGSPSAQKFFVLWNPSSCLKLVNPISEVSHLFAEMIQHGLRCIAFCRSRKLTEIVLSYTREILQETAPNFADSIAAYRAGYIAEDRRKIEKDFFSGRLCGIAATNALELGIDVGHIDATLHLGFPGSISSLWQQAGRSGRREKASLAVYIAFEGPLDQYFMKFPKKLFDGPIECCHIDAQNEQVLEQHLVCAALEHPLSLEYDEKYFGHSLENAVKSLKTKGYLGFDPSREASAQTWSYIGREKMPSRGISIRAIENVRYRVTDIEKKEVLEEIEESRAFFQVYDGAVYMHQGKTYLVKELNLSEKIAFCHETNVNYYTKTRDYTDIHVLGGNLVSWTLNLLFSSALSL